MLISTTTALGVPMNWVSYSVMGDTTSSTALVVGTSATHTVTDSTTDVANRRSMMLMYGGKLAMTAEPLFLICTR
eukprot:5862778-Karenia_brevis.AAC.1